MTTKEFADRARNEWKNLMGRLRPVLVQWKDKALEIGRRPIGFKRLSAEMIGRRKAGLVKVASFLSVILAIKLMGGHASSGGDALPAVTGVSEPVANRLEQANREDQEAIARQLDTVRAFFAERKKGAGAFADDALGWAAKMQMANSTAEYLAKGVSRLLGETPGDGPDSMTVFLKRSFERHVLSPDQLKTLLNDASKGFVKAQRDDEARLLVDLRADIGESDLPALADLPAVKYELASAETWDASKAYEAAVGNAFVSPGSYLAGMWISDKLTEPLVGNINEPAVRAGVSVAAGWEIGNAVDAGISRAAAALGHRPREAIVADIEASLDRICTRLIDGVPSLRDLHASYDAYALVHEDKDARTTFRLAAEYVEQHFEIGLACRLEHRRVVRLRDRLEVLSRHGISAGLEIPEDQLARRLAPSAKRGDAAADKAFYLANLTTVLFTESNW